MEPKDINPINEAAANPAAIETNATPVATADAPQAGAPVATGDAAQAGAPVATADAPQAGAPVATADAPQAGAPVATADAPQAGAPVATADAPQAGAPVATADAPQAGAPVATADAPQAPPLTSTIIKNKDVTCNGGNDGSATITPSGGATPYTYLWDNGETTQTALTLNAGIHHVLVTDINGSTTTSEITINQPEALTSALTKNKDVTCYGGNDGSATVTASGGTAPYTYLWDNGETNQIAINLTAGPNNVLVTDINGCTTKSLVIISQPHVLACALTKNNDVSCNGGNNGSATANPSGGTEPYTYAWDDGETTQTVAHLGAGIHTMSLIDANGYRTTATVTITQPHPLVADINKNKDVSCAGGNNGSATANPSGGTAPYNYLWSNGENAQTAIQLNAGIQSVVVTDANGCSTNASIAIAEPTPLGCNVTKNNDVYCNGASNGSATATPSGGTHDYTYLWDNGETTQTATQLSAGTHNVVVTDANGCSATFSVSIGQPTLLSSSVIKNNDVYCNGGNDGSATVTPFGGIAPYTYLWDNNETTQMALALNAAVHKVVVTDANGCQTNSSIVIGEPPLLSCSAKKTQDVSCYGRLDGAAIVTPVGGTPNYTYVWDNGERTALATRLSAGDHSVVITDANGCEATCNVLIDQPSILVGIMTKNKDVSRDESSTSNALRSDGSATITLAGGKAPYTYLWDNGETTSIATQLSAGEHSVVVTDANGCSETYSVTIAKPAPAPLSTSCDITNVSDSDGNDGEIKVFVMGGTPPYTASTDHSSKIIMNSGDSADFGDLTAKTYRISVKDSLGERTQTVATVQDSGDDGSQ